MSSTGTCAVSRVPATGYQKPHTPPSQGPAATCQRPTDATPFTDVSGSADDIACIFGLAVTGGTSPTTYSPTDYVTRQQMAAFLARIYREMTGEECSGGTEPFTDVSASSSAKDDIACIFGLGITGGTSPTTYSPTDYVTRQQMAAFLARTWRTPALLVVP